MANGLGATAIVGEWARDCRATMVMVAMSCGQGRNGAEDIVQKALTKAVSIARLDPKALEGVRDPCRWLSTITRNVEHDSRTKRQRRARIQSENAEEISETVCGLGDSGWDLQLLSEQVQDTAKKTLTPRQRDIVNCMLNGMADEQIAKEFSVTEATVRWHRHRAVQTLKGALLGSSLGQSG